MIILVCGEKGGTGKSTTAQNLAVYCSTFLKKSVVLVDVDIQGTSNRWATRRKNNSLSDILTVAIPDGNYRKINEYSRRHDVVIVDAGGRDTDALRSAMIAADIIVSPFRPTINDLDTLPKMKKMIDLVKLKFNPKLRVCSVLSQCQPDEVERNKHALSKMAQYGFPPIEWSTSMKSIHDDVARKGMTVLEMNNATLELKNSTIAKTEMLAICKQVMKMGGM